MPFVKVIKNKSYFSRFQVKFRRRREGKTDYRARKNMIIQDLNKYGAPKFRLVVRITNTDIVCQIVRAKITGDFVVASAYSHELVNYGIKHGLTNYAAAYATGLMVARRVLKKFKLDSKYIGLTEASGEDFTVTSLVDESRPLYVLMDVGLVRTSTGNRVFAAMKGALDGGLNIPHSNTRFVGYFKDSSDPNGGTYNPDIMRKYIYGGHVAEFMEKLLQDDPEAYRRQFSRYIKDSITSEMLEGIYKSAHHAIRANPVRPKKQRPKNIVSKYPKKLRLTLEQRKARIAHKLSQKASSNSQPEQIKVQ